MTNGQMLAFLVGLTVGSLATSEIWRRFLWKDFQRAIRDLRAYEKLMKIRLQEDGDEHGQQSDRSN